MTDRYDLQTDLDAALRDLLAPQAGAAPMPTGVLEVPDAWIRRRGMWGSSWPRGAALMAAAIGAVVIALIALGRPGGFMPVGSGAVTRGEAAALLDVPINQVLTTADGAVAIRRDGPSGEVVLVRRDGTDLRTQQLIAFTAPSSPSVHWTAGPISCDDFTALQQPNIVFGQTPADAEGMVLDGASGSGTWNDDFFLFALDGAAVPDDAVVVVRGVRDGMSVGSVGAMGWTFDQSTPCGHWADAARGVTPADPLRDTMCVGFGDSVIGPSSAMPPECTVIIGKAAATLAGRPERALVFTHVVRTPCDAAVCQVPALDWRVVFTYDDGSATRLETVRDERGYQSIVIGDLTRMTGQGLCLPSDLAGADSPLDAPPQVRTCDLPALVIPTPAAPPPSAGAGGGDDYRP